MLNGIIRVYIYTFMACICVTHITLKYIFVRDIIYRIFDIFNLFVLKIIKNHFYIPVAPEAPPDAALFKSLFFAFVVSNLVFFNNFSVFFIKAAIAPFSC